MRRNSRICLKRFRILTKKRIKFVERNDPIVLFLIGEVRLEDFIMRRCTMIKSNGLIVFGSLNSVFLSCITGLLWGEFYIPKFFSSA